MDEKKPSPTPENQSEKQPADTSAEKPKSHIVDRTAEFLGMALIITGAKKA